MYSQNNEDETILKYFPAGTGRFLDIGAYDGRRLSNTLALLENGWGGVMIEPSPSIFIRLIETTKDYTDRVTLVNTAISTESKLTMFYDARGDAVSSIDEAHRAVWEKGSNTQFLKFFVKTTTIKDLFDTFGFDFQFINLDIEGKNYAIYKEIKNFISAGALPSLKMLCIEHDGCFNEIAKEMKPFGFEKVLVNSENIILWKS